MLNIYKFMKLIYVYLRSLPSWECGLKFQQDIAILFMGGVVDIVLENPRLIENVKEFLQLTG